MDGNLQIVMYDIKQLRKDSNRAMAEYKYRKWMKKHFNEAKTVGARGSQLTSVLGLVGLALPAVHFA